MCVCVSLAGSLAFLYLSIYLSIFSLSFSPQAHWMERNDISEALQVSDNVIKVVRPCFSHIILLPSKDLDQWLASVKIWWMDTINNG